MRLVRCALLGALLCFAGCKATPPGRPETQAITFAEHHLLVGNRTQKNPLRGDAKTWADGKEAYSHYCVACHGTDGRNTGVPFADRMSPPIPQLSSPQVQQFTDGQLKWILDNGIAPSGMPGSKGTLSDDELWSIIVFIRRLPPEGSQGIPDLYSH